MAIIIVTVFIIKFFTNFFSFIVYCHCIEDSCFSILFIFSDLFFNLKISVVKVLCLHFSYCCCYCIVSVLILVSVINC